MARELTSSGVQRLWGEISVAVTMFLVVFVACLIGIWSRPVGLLASVWPANAMLLGLLLRWPAAGRRLPLLSAALAFVVADLLTGASLRIALSLNFVNLVSVGVAYAVLSRMPSGVRRLRFPLALFWIVLASALGGSCAALLGIFLAPGSMQSPWLSFAMWSVTETVNYLAFLPVVLSAPGREALAKRRRQGRAWRRRNLFPAISVLVSCVIALLIGGPGAVAVPVLALLWCGLVYPVFPTTLLTLLFGSIALGAITAPLLVDADGGTDWAAVISLRIGVAVVALMPVLLAMMTRTRNELTARLRHLAHHDGLTGIQNRAAFLEKAGAAFATARSATALLLLDLDRFKSVNDTWGHAAGDMVLIETVRRISGILRSSDHFARVGGEEFAILLVDCQPDEARRIAERLRQAVEARPIKLADGCEISMTVSIGVVQIQPPMHETLATVMMRADRCLYSAKAEGRNRVKISAMQNVAEGPRRAEGPS